jgi:hypothetical protein
MYSARLEGGIQEIPTLLCNESLAGIPGSGEKNRSSLPTAACSCIGKMRFRHSQVVLAVGNYSCPSHVARP